MVKVIGFAGAIGAGKDESVDYLRNTYPNVAHIKFAHLLQDIVALIGGLYQEDLSHRKLFDNREWKEHYPLLEIDGEVFTPRDLQKRVGDGLRYSIHPKIWVQIVENTVELLPNYYVACVSDMRYPNELEWVDAQDGIRAYVSRQSAEQEFYKSLESEGKAAHPSEAFLAHSREEADVVIDNNSDLSYLYLQLDKLYKLIRNPEK